MGFQHRSHVVPQAWNTGPMVQDSDHNPGLPPTPAGLAGELCHLIGSLPHQASDGGLTEVTGVITVLGSASIDTGTSGFGCTASGSIDNLWYTARIAELINFIILFKAFSICSLRNE